MARITIEDCLEKIPDHNHFKVALIAALYCRNFLMKGQFAADADTKNGNKPPVCALRAIADGTVGVEMLEKITN